MTFTESLKTCFSKYADFNGRASRSEFWWFVLFVLAGAVVTSFIHETLYLLFALAVLLPSIAVAARRLHDTNRSGWLQLVGFIPLIGLILLYFYAQEPREPNRFDDAAHT